MIFMRISSERFILDTLILRKKDFIKILNIQINICSNFDLSQWNFEYFL